MLPQLSSPGWPTEAARGQRSLRRFIVISLLAHALAVALWPHFRPFSAVDRNRPPLAIDFRPLAPRAAPEPSRPPAAANEIVPGSPGVDPVISVYRGISSNGSITVASVGLTGMVRHKSFSCNCK